MADCPWRDLTIRSRRDTKAKTELAKIKEGHGFRYFYGWIDDNDKIVEWMLIDLDKLRASGLLEKPRREIPNKDKDGNPDGTYFICIKSIELFNADCTIAYRLLNKTKPFLVRKLENARYVDHFKTSPVKPSLWEATHA
jgi:hypothetical protein